VIDGCLLDHSAKLEPEGDAWLMRYPLGSADPRVKHSFDTNLPIVGETRGCAHLVLRGHEPPEIPADPHAGLLLLLRLPRLRRKRPNHARWMGQGVEKRNGRIRVDGLGGRNLRKLLAGTGMRPALCRRSAENAL
jgi:hypothetical protein